MGILQRAGKARAAVFGLCLNAQTGKFPGDDALQTKGGCGHPFIALLHGFLPPEKESRWF